MLFVQYKFLALLNKYLCIFLVLYYHARMYYCKVVQLTLGACAARVTVVVLSVCLFVYDYSSTSGYEAAYKRYQQLQCYKGTKTNVAIWLKRLRSRDMARKQAKKPICIMSTGLPRPGLARSTYRGRIKLR